MCSPELSDLEISIWQEYVDDGVTLVGITAVNQGQIDQFVIDNGLTFPILKDTRSGPGIGTGIVYDQYYIPNQGSPYPRDFIIGTDGIVYYSNNEIDTQSMIAIIETLLDEQEVSVLDENSSIQQQLKLVKAYPNPFNSSISINFNITNQSNIQISIFDLNGRLISNNNLGIRRAGNQSIHWSPSHAISSGTYLYSIESQSNIINGKVLYLK